MESFGRAKVDRLVPVSIKIRVTSGCFHREHSPHAYRIIDDYLSRAELSDMNYRIEPHESGPEILTYVAEGVSVAASIIALITAIIEARSQGIKKGDRPSDPLELIVRSHSKDGEYFEETLLRIPPDHPITPREVEKILAKAKMGQQEKNSVKIKKQKNKRSETNG
jgi:hypothetical protein